jgi:hypothetical protein
VGALRLEGVPAGSGGRGVDLHVLRQFFQVLLRFLAEHTQPMPWPDCVNSLHAPLWGAQGAGAWHICVRMQMKEVPAVSGGRDVGLMCSGSCFSSMLRVLAEHIPSTPWPVCVQSFRGTTAGCTSSVAGM